jgi:LmbE family N-acetylglucosaminyl deacetylase
LAVRSFGLEKAMLSETSVYFSPHLDDVVLSCGAQILAERAEGRRVVVATLFSACGEDEEGRLEQVPPDLQPLDEESLVQSFRRSLHELPFIRSYLQPGEEWHWCEAELIRRLTAPWREGGSCLRPVLTTTDEAGLARIAAAVAEYTSQVSVLFGTMASYREQSRAYAAELGGAAVYAERFWRASG